MNLSQPAQTGFHKSIQENTPRWILLWIIATANINLIGFFIFNKLSLPIDGLIFIVIEALILGAAVGTLQWLLLAVRIPKIKAWIPATIIAYVIFLLGINILFELITQYNSELIQYWSYLPEPILSVIINAIYGKINLGEFLFITGFNIFFGLPVGIAQWILLRSKRRNAFWWILIHLLCTFFASLFGFRTDENALSIYTFFVLYAIFSGIAMDIWFKIRMPENNPTAIKDIYQGTDPFFQ